MKPKIFVLIDFSPYSKYQLSLAEQCSQILTAELVLVHALRIYVPGMADGETRETLRADSKQEVRDQLKDLAVQYLSPDTPVKFHISESSIIETLRQLTAYTKNSLVCVGLKGKGLLQKIFMGSTSVDVINSIHRPVLTVPKQVSRQSFEQFVVAVNYEHPLNTTEFDKVVENFKVRLKSLKFITILNSGAKEADATQYLKELTERYTSLLPSSYDIYSVDQTFLQVKTVMQQYEHGLLVVQRGSRNLTDQLFRSFFVNQIVYDASIPLLVIPE